MINPKKDNKIMQELKLLEMRYFIAHTDKGILMLQLRKGETEYQLTLDAVPLAKEQHDTLMHLLFDKEIPQPAMIDLESLDLTKEPVKIAPKKPTKKNVRKAH